MKKARGCFLALFCPFSKYYREIGGKRGPASGSGVHARRLAGRWRINVLDYVQPWSGLDLNNILAQLIIFRMALVHEAKNLRRNICYKLPYGTP